MSALVRAIYDFGARCSPPSPFADSGDDYYCLEVGGDRLVLSRVEGRPISLPRPVARGSNANTVPNHGWDSVCYVLRWEDTKKIGKLRGEAFWRQAPADAAAAGLPSEVVDAIARAAKQILKLRTDLKPKEKEVVVLTFDGVAIGSMPKFRKWLTAKADVAADETTPKGIHFRKWLTAKANVTAGEPTHTDMVTGEPCMPVRLHEQVTGVPGTGGKVPLISFEKVTYTFDDRENGENFPVSSETSQTYAAGLRYLVENNLARFGDSYSAILWPAVGATEHPIVPLAKQVLGSILKAEATAALWAEVRALPATDATPIAVLLLRGAKGRISVLNYQTFEAGHLRDSLLRFYEEFAPWRSNVTFPAVAVFPRAQGETKIVFDGLMLPLVAWSVVSGDLYPDALLSLLALDDAAAIPEDNLPLGGLDIFSAWDDAVRTRRFGGKQKEVSNVDQDNAIEALLDQVPVDLHWIKKHLYTPVDDPDEIFFRYGMAVSFFDYLGVHFHGSTKATHRDVTLSQALGDPQQFFVEFYNKALVYADGFARKGYRDAKVVESLFRFLVLCLDDAFRARKHLSRSDKSHVIHGYHFADSWNVKFFSWHWNKNKKTEPKAA